jgi:hypothetical protein
MAQDITTNELSAEIGGVAEKVDRLVETADNLAISTARGFENTAAKEDLAVLRQEMNARFNETTMRLDRIEGALYRALDNRIERLEDRVRVVETSLGAANN